MGLGSSHGYPLRFTWRCHGIFICLLCLKGMDQLPVCVLICSTAGAHYSAAHGVLGRWVAKPGINRAKNVLPLTWYSNHNRTQHNPTPPLPPGARTLKCPAPNAQPDQVQKCCSDCISRRSVSSSWPQCTKSAILLQPAAPSRDT